MTSQTMIIKRQVGEKGQVVIPKDIRKMLNLSKGSEIIFEIQDNRIELKKEENAEKFIEEYFKGPKLKMRLSVKQIKKDIEEQDDIY